MKTKPRTIITDCGRSAAGLKESRDCTVRATSAVLGITYKQAHAKLAELGREPRSGVVYGLVAPHLGLISRPELACRTYEKILPELQRGRFVVRHARHVFAVINGVAVDLHPRKAKLRVKNVWQLPEPGTVPL